MIIFSIDTKNTMHAVLIVGNLSPCTRYYLHYDNAIVTYT